MARHHLGRPDDQSAAADPPTQPAIRSRVEVTNSDRTERRLVVTQMAKSHWQIEQHDFPTCDGASQQRRVTVAIPPVEDVNRRPVVYCTDGQVVETLAAELQRTLPEREQPILIGVHSHPQARAQEYLLNSSESFLAHERFFAEKSIRKSMLKLLRSLQRQEVSVEYRERACGHTLDFWASEFVAAIHWFNQTAR